MAKSAGSATDGQGQNGTNDTDRVDFVPLGSESRRRYLNYAMSVITSRALPDARDGLKPVQRRILYAMYRDLRLVSNGRTIKCAKIVGETTGNYHPHGTSAVYEALVRMAQDFTLRTPLIFGQGNFGSVMGLPAAAERYTEAKLTPLAELMIDEIGFQTTEMRANYDSSREEPVVFPSKWPNLLVNGTSGIAVGMATNIPPHNLGEVIQACEFLIENPEADTKDLLKFIKAPDFPLGGRLVTDRKEIRAAYEEGRGTFKVRGEWRWDKRGRTVSDTQIVIHSVPYQVDTSALVGEIATIVTSRKLPQLLDVSDETTEQTGLRIVLEVKPGSDPEATLAYLYKHTSLEQNFAYNATCLAPNAEGTLVPERLSLVDLLRHFLYFRLETVRKRTAYLLKQLEHRIHVLEGFAIVFNDLDKALKIIRNSSGRQDAAEKLMKVFPLDSEQTFAILDIALYRISQLEINTILDELELKRTEATKLRRLLASEKKLWDVVKTELLELGAKYSDPRRTSLGKSDEITEFDATTYIVRENTNVVLTRDGWIKRVTRLQSVNSTRVREGDSVRDVLPGSTLDTVIFFASDGVAYTLAVDQIPPSSGYGEPLSKHVRLNDGATIIGGLSTDPRFTPADVTKKGEELPQPHVIAVTRLGNVIRIPLGPFRAVSTKVGRRFCRLVEGDRVVFVQLWTAANSMFIATKQARLIHFAIDEVPVLSGAGKGVRGIKLVEGDEVLDAKLMASDRDQLQVRLTGDKTVTFGQGKYSVTARGGKGIRTSHRSQFVEVIQPEITLIDWSKLEGGETK